jgi:methylthioribose-1-phosphate isomerase
MNSVQSPLFEPVLWEGGGFRILDEISLPEQIQYISVKDASQAIDAVREMKTRAFGQVLTFLYSGALLAQNYHAKEIPPLRESIDQLTHEFCRARPTFDFRGLGQYFDEWFEKLPGNVSAGEWISDQACNFAAQIVRARGARAKRAAELLPHPARVLTHCNMSGELLAIAQHCATMSKDFAVIATETRPYLQGARLTAWELARGGVRVALIPDCAITQVMARGEVNAVVVGSDRAAQNGDIINKVGTYPLAVMAKRYGVPFHVLVQDPRSLVQGSDVQIEERPGAELLSFQGRRLISDANVAVRYPAFDVTPAPLITHLIGFDGVYTPESFRRKYQQQRAPARSPIKDGSKYLLVYGIPPLDQRDHLIGALKAERASRFFITEMRAHMWGVHAVAPALLEHDLPTTLISDNMIGFFFARDEISKLYLYYSRLDPQGATGICGSLLALELARAHGVPVELLASDSVKRLSIDSDVSTFMGTNICPRGASIFPLESEVIPSGLFKEFRD